MVSSEENETVTIACFAKDFSPNTYNIKWWKNKEITGKVEEIKIGSEERQNEDGNKVYSAASFLTVQTSDLPLDTKFTCEFQGKGKKGDEFLNSTVVYPPKNSGEYICYFSFKKNDTFFCNNFCSLTLIPLIIQTSRNV